MNEQPAGDDDFGIIEDGIGSPSPSVQQKADDALSRIRSRITSLEAERNEDWEQRRKIEGWPTPMHMRRVADALDAITPARYGAVLRWVADACDRALSPDPTTSEE